MGNIYGDPYATFGLFNNYYPNYPNCPGFIPRPNPNLNPYQQPMFFNLYKNPFINRGKTGGMLGLNLPFENENGKGTFGINWDIGNDIVTANLGLDCLLDNNLRGIFNFDWNI
ncbi:MAG: hypothetical protein V2B14_05130 [bacterium]